MTETDITGYGRKMGRDAGLDSDGYMESVVTLQGTKMVGGSVAARTINPGGSEVAGGVGLAGDYAPTEGRGLFLGDGKTGNVRADYKVNPQLSLLDIYSANVGGFLLIFIPTL